MLVNPVSNQNFGAGNLVYVTKKGTKHVEDAYRYLPKYMSEEQKRIGDALRNEPFDVVIIKGKSPLSFSIKASDGEKETQPIKVQLRKTQYTNLETPYENSNDLLIGIYKSIANFGK